MGVGVEWQEVSRVLAEFAGELCLGEVEPEGAGCGMCVGFGVMWGGRVGSWVEVQELLAYGRAVGRPGGVGVGGEWRRGRIDCLGLVGVG